MARVFGINQKGTKNGDSNIWMFCDIPEELVKASDISEPDLDEINKSFSDADSICWSDDSSKYNEKENTEKLMKKPFNLMKFDEISKKKATKFEAKQLQQKAGRDKKPKSRKNAAALDHAFYEGRITRQQAKNTNKN